MKRTLIAITLMLICGTAFGQTDTFTPTGTPTDTPTPTLTDTPTETDTATDTPTQTWTPVQTGARPIEAAQFGGGYHDGGGGGDILKDGALYFTGPFILGTVDITPTPGWGYFGGGVRAPNLDVDATAIATNSAGVSVNATAVATNSTAIKAHQTAIPPVQTNVSANATAVATNGAAIEVHQTAIPPVQTNVSANVTAIATNSVAIEAHQTAIPPIETDIAAVQATATALAGKTIDTWSPPLDKTGTVASLSIGDGLTTRSDELVVTWGLESATATLNPTLSYFATEAGTDFRKISAANLALEIGGLVGDVTPDESIWMEADKKIVQPAGTNGPNSFTCMLSHLDGLASWNANSLAYSVSTGSSMTDEWTVCIPDYLLGGSVVIDQITLISFEDSTDDIEVVRLRSPNLSEGGVYNHVYYDTSISGGVNNTDLLSSDIDTSTYPGPFNITTSANNATDVLIYGVKVQFHTE